jgi:hypothetical protein
MTRHAACSCGQLHLAIDGEPSRISMCHCLECQRRTGAVISNQARFRDACAFMFPHTLLSSLCLLRGSNATENESARIIASSCNWRDRWELAPR